MRIHTLLLLLSALVWPTSVAAVAIDFAGSGCTDNFDGTWTCDGNVIEDFSGASFFSYNFDLENTNTVSFEVDLEPAEQVVTWNALYFYNIFTENLDRYDITLTGASVTVQGDVFDDFQNEVPNVTVTGGIQIEIDFEPFTTNFDIGDAAGLGGSREDWELTADAPGGSFTIVMTPTLVPEPGTAVLALIGLVGLGGLRRANRL